MTDICHITTIANTIASGLSTKDLFQCLYVNSRWKKYFISFAHRSYIIKSRHEFRAFYQCLKATETTESWGRHVNILIMTDNVGISRDEFESLVTLCPFIRHLILPPRLWHYSRCTSALSRWKYLDTLPNLSVSKIANYYIPLFGKQLRCLNFSLALTGEDTLGQGSYAPDFDINTIDTIHTHCPMLECVHLMHVFLNEPETGVAYTSRDLTPAKRMKQFNVESTQIHGASWMFYFSQKYPTLTTFTWSNVQWVENKHSYNTNYASYTIGQLSLVEHLVHLKKFKLHGGSTRTWCHDDLFTILGLNNVQFDELRMTFPHSYTFFNPMSRSLFHNMLLCLHQNTQSIGLSTWTDINIHRDITHHLSRVCPYLTELILYGEKLEECNAVQFTLNHLLNSLKHLKRLSITSIDIEISNESGLLTEKHGLECLDLDSVWLTEDCVFQYLNLCCPQLSSMSLHNCTWRIKKPSLEIRIDMPHHKFKKFGVCIMNVSHYIGNMWAVLDTGTLFSMTKVAHNKKTIARKRLNTSYGGQARRDEGMTRWYHLYKTDGRTSVRRLKSQEAKFIQDYRMSAKDYKDMFEQDPNMTETVYHSKEEWKKSITSGYATFRFHSIDMFIYDFVML
ncbi:hypothetical protein BDF14DRAFT_1998572 [Spinellus fusiger]|nr:hypothetical protein BDF14DRAFT_1998572 [Spinellus fusiger]